MAYDANSAYQPPQRAYYGQAQQQQQQAPVQQSYGQATQEQYGGYGQPAYEQGYGEQQYGQAPSQPQQSDYSDGYYGGYQKKARPMSGDRLQQRQPAAPQQQAPQNERSYDPRYQQRTGRTPPAGAGHHPGQRAQQPPPQTQQQAPAQQAQQYDRSYDSRHQQPNGRTPPPATGHHPGQRAQQQPSRAHEQRALDRQAYQESPANLTRPTEPKNGYSQPDNQSRQPDPRSGHPAPAPQQRLPEPRAAEQPRQPLQPQKQDPKKMTMEEWKAAEKARLHKDAASPEHLAQDNAFPTFPNKKKDRTTDRSGTTTAMSKRSSEDQSRSSIASSGPKHGEHFAREQRPSMSRDDGYQNEAQTQQNGLLAPHSRPSMDHKPFSSEPLQQTKKQSPPQAQQQRPAYDRQLSDQRTRQQSNGAADERQQHWPAQSAPPRDDRRTPPHPQGYRQTPPPAQDPYGQPAYVQERKTTPQEARFNTLRSRQPVPAINTAQSRKQPPAAYMDHQPLSPAQVPPRPNTAQAGRSPASNLQATNTSSPQSGLSYSHTPIGYATGDAVPQDRWAEQQQQHQQHVKQESLDDVYAGYHDQQLEPEPQSAGPRSDREIDAEMPDFDSAAPGGTSMLHKRNQTVDKHLADAPRSTPPRPMPAMPTQHPNMSVQSLPNAKPRQHQQAPDPYRDMVQQKQRLAQSQTTGGFDFGVPQQQQRQQTHQQQYQPEQGYGQVGPYELHALPVQPPHPAYANEQPVRRSMDDARQMPYRQGPPQPTRFAANGQPPRGQYPPPQRPGLDERNLSGQTVQTVWSDPGQQRVPSAPPLQQGLRQPPSRAANGAPLTQQRSAPEYAEQRRESNPDALPHHPVPVRPGLMEGGGQQPAKPAPVRSYDSASFSSSPHGRKASLERPSQPITHAELDRLRAEVAANPANNKQALLLAKKLVEASTVLAAEGGRADPKTAAKNRENYILEAYKRIKKLASAGYPDAQFYLADSYGQGSLGLEVDTKEAFNMYQAAAKQGHPQAAYRTAVCCEMGPEEGGGTRKDYAKAVQWYRRASALGDVAAMYKLGIILLKGLLGQQRNIGESVTWLKRAAERADKDNPHALHELGGLYESGNTHPEVRGKILADDSYARELYTQAANLGYKFSQFRLGQAHEYGSLNLPIDNRASISWYSKAAAQGEHQAELALSGWYLTGADGILEHSDTEAYLWARKAAQAEPPLAKAMFAMGYFSEMGIGCPASVEEARRWYGRAASYKFPKALERLEELKKSGGKSRPVPANGKLSRKDQKRDEAECAVM